MVCIWACQQWICDDVGGVCVACEIVGEQPVTACCAVLRCVCVLQGFINVLNWYLLPPGESLSS